MRRVAAARSAGAVALGKEGGGSAMDYLSPAAMAMKNPKMLSPLAMAMGKKKGGSDG
jgi:hypothetical protein